MSENSSDYKSIVPARFLTCVALAGIAGASFALTRWSDGIMELAAWLVLAFCAGGLVSILQKRG
ncbi:MAG: hypothetical protein COA84_02170 [Robiginitomaculum sp.]|nr:MAG: hypothetical protein COA84_02170 [Robiginitomaculum sp.]